MSKRDEDLAAAYVAGRQSVNSQTTKRRAELPEKQRASGYNSTRFVGLFIIVLAVLGMLAGR